MYMIIDGVSDIRVALISEGVLGSGGYGVIVSGLARVNSTVSRVEFVMELLFPILWWPIYLASCSWMGIVIPEEIVCGWMNRGSRAGSIYPILPPLLWALCALECVDGWKRPQV
jgi:hypothetical protein